jgi:prepilin-type N-terminal cleavage/methylation domain-containing protein
MKKFHKGFTVLELLIVIAIMAILMSLILVGLQSARSHARDQDKVTNLRTIVVGVTQFYDICRMYPASLDSTTTCPSLGTKTLGDIIPNLADYHFDATGSDYTYTALSGDTTDQTDCTNFHIGVHLDGNVSSFSSQKSSFNSTIVNLPLGMVICSSSTFSGFDGTVDSVFDIKK